MIPAFFLSPQHRVKLPESHLKMQSRKSRQSLFDLRILICPIPAIVKHGPRQFHQRTCPPLAYQVLRPDVRHHNTLLYRSQGFFSITSFNTR